MSEVDDNTDDNQLPPPPFAAGDVVRRIQQHEYPDPKWPRFMFGAEFVVKGVEQGVKYRRWIVDPDGELHNPDNLELVTRPEPT